MPHQFVILFVSFLLCNCAYDPYQMQVYNQVGDSLLFAGEENIHVYVVDSGKLSDESYPPYRIGFWLMSDDDDSEVIIEKISISLNGEELSGISFKEIKSGIDFPVPGVVKQPNPAPCCRFMVISSDLPIGHTVGDMLDVFISLNTHTSISTHKSKSTFKFKAAIKKGRFQMVGV